ncbi:type IVB secretion system protein IcmH/DotU [Aliikangiella sp. G2MR2-5]|uniref:type IVB secretion system protein IcmH/DotU n=1 Tax=Aliikangiella sp. G2MR2-5 TaxID=2788943 RepID=UPI0018A88EC7|nr:type IVB secretion system protein IcmH/DotU [Aliikangiella sp. G2MR2-5]
MNESGDKTVFRPRGSTNPDQTIIRPTPGRRKPVASREPAVATAAQRTNYASHTSHGHPVSFEVAAGFQTLIGLNPIVKAAANLIAVFEKTRNTLNHPDVPGLYSRLSNEIKTFHAEVQAMGYKPEIALAARYIVCSALDEAVLNTPWGTESHWPQKTLLSVFHNETSGGEKFFQILDRLKSNPSENLEMLELFYVFLSLGFEGRYRFANRGRDAIEQVRDEVFAVIRNYRGEYERSLSNEWQGIGSGKKGLTQYLPMWVVASIVAALLVVSYSGFRYWLFESSSPVVKQLDDLAKTESKK